MDIQAQIDALEAKRMQRKGEVDTEREANLKHRNELQNEFNALAAEDNKLYADWLIENARFDGKLELLRQMLEDTDNGNHAAE